ncbi:MAG TPA: PstS family phosphate ABC transporter substrate-binding protein, partial [Halanaerobiales bacterium]|nr:PstS family phosphate ABC transporter substrate-binding protein [Halanaerobiales bacterium]
MFNKKVIFSVIAMLMMVLMSFGMVSAQDITVQGSSTVLPVAQKAAEVYMDNNPNVNISVRGGGSGNGIAALIDGSTDIADASRFIKFEEVENAVENGIYPVPHRIAMDGIAVVVNNANPVEDLSLEQIKSIYTGRISNWSDLDGVDFDKEIVIVSRDSSSGTFGVFNDVVNDGKIDGNPIRLTPTALTQSS